MFNNTHVKLSKIIRIIFLMLLLLILMFCNKAICIVLLSWGIAQVLKVIISSIKNKKFVISTYGGMPSSHSAITSSVVTYFLLKYGIANDIIVIPLVFFLITISDAKQVRLLVGEIAAHLNIHLDLKNDNKLNENVGHKTIEIVVGTIIGIVSTVVLYFII